MRTRRYMAALVVGILVGGLLTAARANAGTLHWTSWGGDFDPSVGLASNLNSTVVVGVGRTDRKVRYRDASGGPWTDLGIPTTPGGAPATVRRLATSAGEIYAVDDGGRAFHYDRVVAVWEHIGDGLVDLLASRDGTTVTPVNEPPRFDPYLFGVDVVGRVWRREGQGWSIIGSGAARDSLVERGPRYSTSLFMLTATRDKVLRWMGTGAGWTVIRNEPAEMIVANLTTLAATADGSGQIELYIDAPGSPPNWKPMAMEPYNSIPFGAGGRMWLGDRSLYYRPPGRDELWAERFVVALPPGVAVIPLPWLLSRTAVAAVAPHQTTGDDADAVALGATGWTSDLSWGVLTTIARGAGAPFDVAGSIPMSSTSFRTAPIEEWSGDLGILRITGTPVPGLGMTLDFDGKLWFVGTPTSTGRFTFTLTVIDDTGAAVDVNVDLLVTPPGSAWDVVPTWPNPAGFATVTNCLSSGSPMTVWYSDRTVYPPGLAEYGRALDSGLVTGPGGVVRCAPTVASMAFLTPTPGHIVEVMALDPTLPTCGGHVDDVPTIACVADRFFVTGQSGAGVRDFPVR